jgi:signal peptidase
MTRRGLQITGRWFLRLVLVALLAAIAGALAVLVVVPRAVNGAALTVLTGSMTPTIPAGSVVVVRPVDTGTLRVGDIVTYQKAPGAMAEYITHRITALHLDTTPVTLTTKGDANRTADLKPVPVTAVRGKVVMHVPHLGSVRESIGIKGSGLVLVLLALLGYAVSQVVAVLRDRRRPKAAAAPAAGDLRVQLLVSTLRLSQFPDSSPRWVAERLGVDLLDEGPDTFTVALARTPEELDRFLELLGPLAAVRHVRSDIVSLPADRRPELVASSAGPPHA